MFIMIIMLPHDDPHDRHDQECPLPRSRSLPHLLGDVYGNGSHSHSNERHAVCPLSVPQSVRLFAHTIIGDSAQKGFRSIDR